MMISRTPLWQSELSRAVHAVVDLLEYLELKVDDLPYACDFNTRFPLRVPLSFVQRMQKANPYDPLLLQVLPLMMENQSVLEYQTDPVGDLQVQNSPGLLHKYRGRVLLILSGACAIHCRYCFRREYPYAEAQVNRRYWQTALEYIQSDTSLHEIILSGGDPLSLKDERLAEMVSEIAQVEHIKRLRIHTRMPIVLPERVDQALLDWLGNTRLTTIVVVHVNHAQEIDDNVIASMNKFRDCGVSLLNQSVLLRNVNDSVEALILLSERLFAAGILPYYLHVLDKVQGSAHFDVEEARAVQLIDQMRVELPGYLVPRLVREIAGQPYKVLLD